MLLRNGGGCFALPKGGGYMDNVLIIIALILLLEIVRNIKK